MTNTVNTPTGPALINVSYRSRYPRNVWRIDVETLDWKAALITRDIRTERSREVYKTTRVYGAQDAFVEGFSDEETRLFKAIPNFEVRDPDLARFQRASNKTARVGILGMVPELVEVLGAFGCRVLVPAALDAKFSMKAGCSMCPCSPGFVLTERLLVDGAGFDIHFG